MIHERGAQILYQMQRFVENLSTCVALSMEVQFEMSSLRSFHFLRFGFNANRMAFSACFTFKTGKLLLLFVYGICAFVHASLVSRELTALTQVFVVDLMTTENSRAFQK